MKARNWFVALIELSIKIHRLTLSYSENKKVPLGEIALSESISCISRDDRLTIMPR